MNFPPSTFDADKVVVVVVSPTDFPPVPSTLSLRLSAETKMKELDPYLRGYKKYQAFVYGLMFLPSFLSGAWTLVFAFTGAVPHARCCIPSLGECDSPSTADYGRFGNESSGEFHSWYYEDEESHGETFCRFCPNSTRLNSTDDGGACTEGESDTCQAYVFDKSQYKSSLSVRYDMVCEGSWKLELSKSMFMLGVLIGAGLFGALADRFGRRPVFLFCALLQMITFNVFPLIADANFYVFQLFHIICGGIQYGSYLSGFIIVMELMQGYPRTVCGIWIQGYFALGYIYVGICAYFIRDWKTLHWVVSAPSFLYIPYYWLLPESYRWDAVNGREEKARATVTKAARWNKITIPERIYETSFAPHKAQQASVVDLFRNWQLAKNTSIVFFTWFVCSMTYYGLSLNTSDLPGDAYTNYLLSGIVELPGFVISVPLMEKWGRKPALFILFGISGLCCIAAGLIPKASLSWLVVTCAVIGKMCVAAAFAVIYNYSAELFPTVVRNAGTGFASLCARIGSIAAPQIHLLAYYAGNWVPIVIYGAFSLSAAALDLFLPETKGRVMPETIQDGIRFSQGKFAMEDYEMSDDPDSPEKEKLKSEP